MWSTENLNSLECHPTSELFCVDTGFLIIILATEQNPRVLAVHLDEKQ